MKHAPFVHLHTHSCYSILDSTCRISDLVERAEACHMPALALTDNSNLFGVVQFFEACRSRGIKPIIGAHVFVAPGDRTDKTPRGIPDESYNLVLLVRNDAGYRNLMKLLTLAYFEGFYYKPRIDKAALREHAEGLIGLSGNLRGEIPTLILQERDREAALVIQDYQDMLGQENFYLELMDHGFKRQRLVNEHLKILGEQTGAPLVAANDSHYMNREDSFAYQIARCIECGTTLNENRSRIEGTDHYFKSPEEMAELFKEYPDSLKNTITIAERCVFELDLTQRYMPDYQPPDGKTQESFLKELCLQGMAGRVDPKSKEVKDRLKHEIQVVRQMGFLSYFLIVWDFIFKAKENGIPVGPGRGSAAGSLIAYLLGITNINPLKYDLLFERFLNPERVSMPDIDIDFCYDRRSEVIDYVGNVYGRRSVAQIITFGTLAARAVIRDVGRVMDISFPKVDSLAKMIPAEPRMTLKRALDMEPAIGELIKEDKEIEGLFNHAFKLEGLPRNTSTHAAGIIIAQGDLTDRIALYRGQGGEVVTQLDGPDSERIGLLKMDFLGLRTLTVLHEAQELVNNAAGKTLIASMDEIPDDDKKTFELLNKANTLGVFQLESSGMRDLMKRLGVQNFSDVVALVALYRPGPMQMADDFIKRKHGMVEVAYLHPKLEPILKETFGIMLYQEQVMQCAQVVGGFSLADADNLRRIMGKKKEEAMLQLKEHFIEGAVRNKIDRPIAEKIFEAMAYFAGYGFNKSHSVAYGWIAYQTAWFKANYPIPFMAALLSSERSNTDKISQYIEECRAMGIPLQPPSVQESFEKFSVEKESIRFGLGAIKGVGSGAVEAVVMAREKKGPFLSMEDFVKRVDNRGMNKKTLESLILAGAFDSLQPNRRYLVEILDDLLRFGSGSHRDKASGQASFLDMLDATEGQVASPKHLKDYPNFPEHDLLRFEKEHLGCYLSGHPLARYARLLKRFSTIHSGQLEEFKDGSSVQIGGVLSSVKITRTNKTNENMALLQLEDLKGTVEAVVFPRGLPAVQSLLEIDTPVFISGIVRYRNDQPGIIVSDMMLLENIQEIRTTHVFVRVYESDGMSRLKELKEILERHPGECAVELDLSMNSGETVVVRPGKQYHIQPTEVAVQEIETLLGEDSVWLHIKDKNKQTFRQKNRS